MIRWVLCSLLVAASACAEVEWRQKEVRLQVHPAQVAAEAVFRFSNGGDKPVSLADVVPACGCMNAKPTKPSYAPGEEGSLVIMIDLRNRTGLLRKKIRVRTGDGHESTLTVAVDIPPGYVANPLVQWGKGDAAEEKTVPLINPNALPVRLLTISSSHPGLPAELKTIREGYEYEAVIRRVTDETNVRSVIRITTEPPPGETESKPLRLYAVIPGNA